MYEAFYGFRERPFDLTPNPRFLVLTDSHREVLSNLEYGITSRKGVTVVVGEAGSGKTTLIRKVIEEQGDRVHCVHVSNPTLTRTEFVELLADRFGLSKEAASSKAVFLKELEQLLLSRRARRQTTVLVVDEAQSLPLELLEEIRLLANTETDDEKLLPLILVGQPELADRLNEQSLRQLKQRVALRCELNPLSEHDTATYIAGRIAVAGGVASHVFTREAVSIMHRASRGVPRLLSVLADNALLGGFARGERPVNSSIVLDVCRDFDLDGHADLHAKPARPVPATPDRLLKVTVDDFSPDAPSAPAAPADLVTVPVGEKAGLFSMFTNTKKKRSFLG